MSCRAALFAVFLSLGLEGWADQPPKESIAAIQDFEKRVEDYLNVRKEASSGLPPLKPNITPVAVNERERALAARIRSLRKDSKQGDIFTPRITAEFRRLIGIATGSPKQTKQIDTSLKHAEPIPLALKVNDSFPAGAPLQSTPPSLLLNLPHLPMGLDYRVVGHSLVLRDSEASTVIDFLPNAIP